MYVPQGGWKDCYIDIGALKFNVQHNDLIIRTHIGQLI